MSLIPGEPPLVHAPSRGDPQLVPWVTRSDLGFLSDFELGPSISLLATALADAVLRPTLPRRIRDGLGLGLALDPQLYLLQLPTEEQQLHFADQIALLTEPLDEAIDPLAELLDVDVAEALAAHLLDLTVSGLGTALLAGSFLLTEASRVGLDNNLALLAGSARYFHDEGLADGADESVRFARPRQLFATVAIDRRVLEDVEFMRELLEAYVAAAPGVYGYWMQVANLPSTPRPGRRPAPERLPLRARAADRQARGTRPRRAARPRLPRWRSVRLLHRHRRARVHAISPDGRDQEGRGA
jgi:hypothetical protein